MFVKDDDIWNYYRQTAIHCVNMVGDYLNKGYQPHEIMILYRITKPPIINKLINYASSKNILIK